MAADSLDRRAARWIVQRADRVIWGIGACLLVTYLAAMLVFPRAYGRMIFGDAAHHFVQLRSLAYDYDLDFWNDQILLYHAGDPQNPPQQLLTPTGHVRNYTPIGPAIVWAPLYFVVSGLLTLAAAVGFGAPPNGFDPLLQAVPGITGVMAATAGTWLSWRFATRLTDRPSATAGALGVWLGGQALYYSLVSPSYSHAISMLASALFFTHWLHARDRWTWRAAAAAGALAGLAALIRWQDAIFLVVPVVECLRAPTTWRDRATGLVAVGAAALLVFSPQIAAWQVLYGRPFTLPQGPGFMQWLAPSPIAVLLSDKHGLFSWSPVLVLAIAGLVTIARRNRSLFLPLGLVVIASWYVNACAADWWAGEAFGARRFLSLFPLFVAGLAQWLQPSVTRGQRGRAVIVAVLVCANGLLLIQYQAFMKGLRDVAPYPEGWMGLWVMRFVVPFRLIGKWIG